MWVKVIDVQNLPKVKVSLSLKYVNQQTGEDIDPKHVMLQEEKAFRELVKIAPGTGVKVRTRILTCIPVQYVAIKKF